MPERDTLQAANEAFCESFSKGDLPMPPGRRLAIVTCMDARLDPARFLGLEEGDAHVIRNAGGLATEDALRCLVISHHLLGTQEFFVIEHTGCGMLTFDEEPVKQRIAKATGADTAALRLYPFKNLEENLTAQVRKIKECPWIPKTIPVHGFIYQVEDGRLRQVV